MPLLATKSGTGHENDVGKRSLSSGHQSISNISHTCVLIQLEPLVGVNQLVESMHVNGTEKMSLIQAVLPFGSRL